MPILPQEPDRHPPTLFRGEAAEAQGRVWWVLHTKPRQEKTLARHLHRAQIPHYLPCLRKTSKVRGKAVTSHVPLFPGYVFLLGDGADRVAALATKRVLRALEVADQDSLWDDLAQVSRLIDLGLPVTPEKQLQPGDLVEIESGPLSGMRGKILQVKTEHKFVVQVNFIQQGASVVLEGFSLAPWTGKPEAE